MPKYSLDVFIKTERLRFQTVIWTLLFYRLETWMLLNRTRTNSRSSKCHVYGKSLEFLCVAFETWPFDHGTNLNTSPRLRMKFRDENWNGLGLYLGWMPVVYQTLFSGSSSLHVVKSKDHGIKMAWTKQVGNDKPYSKKPDMLPLITKHGEVLAKIQPNPQTNSRFELTLIQMLATN